MSANINSMFFVSEVPWHGLGTKLEQAATAEEAIRAAGLDWAVEKRKVFADTPAGLKVIPDTFAVTRMDTNTTLGVVGKKYTPLQNKDAFRFFDAVVGIKEAIYETAGALGDGERIWILAKLNGVIKTTKEDITEKYLLLANGHDGTLTVQMQFTPIRVVCQNTLNGALNSSKLSAKLRHTASVGLKVEEVRETLGIVNAQYSIFEEASQKLAATKMNDKQFADFIGGLGLAPKGERTDANARSFDRQVEVAALLQQLFESGKGTELAGIRGTAWAGYNAVTEYVDHFQNPRVDKSVKLQARAKSLLFGNGAKLKADAFDAALALA